MNFNQTNKKFWESRKDYPRFATKLRRFYELQYLVPQLKGKSLLDLGCGDGSLINCLMATTDIETYYGYDLSPSLLEHVNKNVKTQIYDCTKPTRLPKTDITIMAGLIQCIESDEDVLRLFDMIRSDTIFLRTACTPDNTCITKYSENLGSDYASYYRSVQNVIYLLEEYFTIQDVCRVYPDEIESKYGSHQYYFKVTK